MRFEMILRSLIIGTISFVEHSQTTSLYGLYKSRLNIIAEVY